MTAKEPEPFLSLGFAGISWIEYYLVHGPGDVQGQPVELDDEFAAFVLKAYRVDKQGNRTIRRAFISRAKGRAKSALAAMIACFEALGPCRFDHFATAGEVSAWGYEYETGEPVGKPLTYVEILNVATEESQAGNTYDAIHYMLNPETCSEELLRDYGRIDVGLTRTNLPDQRGFIEPVTSADSSKDGGKSTFIVADETHLWTLPRLKRLHGVMTRNLLKRKIASGWMLETSTMYADGEGSVAEGTHDYARLVSAGRRKDRTLLFDHKQAAATWDLTKRGERIKALREAYGPASDWMNLDAIADSWDDPQVSEAEFRRYWCNQPVPTEEPTPSPVDVAKWDSLVDADPSHAPQHMRAMSVELDLDRAWASIGAAGKRDIDDLIHVEVVDRARGTGWVLNRCAELNKGHGPVTFVVDGGGPASSMIPAMQSSGLTVLVANTKDVGAASAALVDAVNGARLVHGPQTELDSAIRAARSRALGDGAFAFGRKASAEDITPLVAVALAHWAALETRPPEVWSIREMVEQLKKEQAEKAEADVKGPTGA